jgi:hypothetical protein
MEKLPILSLFEDKNETELSKLMQTTLLTKDGVKAVINVTVKASDAAVRHHSFRFMFEWVALQLPDSKIDDLEAIYAGLLAGLTDVWSAIRKTCSRKLGPVLHRFNLDQVRFWLFSCRSNACLLALSTGQSSVCHL